MSQNRLTTRAAAALSSNSRLLNPHVFSEHHRGTALAFQGVRCLSSSSSVRGRTLTEATSKLKVQTFEDLPGLMVIENFLNAEEANRVIYAARTLSMMADNVAKEKMEWSGGKAAIVSPAHNVNQGEQYVSVPLTLHADEEAVEGDHFGSYGEGHKLTYFRGGLPSYGLAAPLDQRIATVPEISSAIAKDEKFQSRRRRSSNPLKPLEWKLTMNRYPSDTMERKGFPWHKDLEANGAATFILALGAPGRLQFAADQEVDGMLPKDEAVANHRVRPDQELPIIRDLLLEPNSLLCLTGEARWNRLHRVAAATGAGAEQERLSLVYGCW